MIDEGSAIQYYEHKFFGGLRKLVNLCYYDDMNEIEYNGLS